MYLNRFRYLPGTVDCKFCTEYQKKKGCAASGACPWLAERIEAGVVSYSEALLDSFNGSERLTARLLIAVQLFNGSLWLDDQHEKRWHNLMARFGYSKRRKDTAKYYAVIYLFAASVELNRLTVNCVDRQRIEFSWADTSNASDEDCALFVAAESIAVGDIAGLLQRLEDTSAVGTSEFCIIVNALLIERYGLYALNIKEKTGGVNT